MKKPIFLVAVLTGLSLGAATDYTSSLEFVGNPSKLRWGEGVGLQNSVYDLHAYGERIYNASGDWGKNLGPCYVTSIDVHTGEVVNEFEAGTDCIDVFRTLPDGRLAFPATDPREGHANCGMLFCKELNGSWTSYAKSSLKVLWPATRDNNGTNGGANEHVFDVTMIDGKLVLCANQMLRYENGAWQNIGGYGMFAKDTPRYNGFIRCGDAIFCHKYTDAYNRSYINFDGTSKDSAIVESQYIGEVCFRWNSATGMFENYTNTCANLACGMTPADTRLITSKGEPKNFAHIRVWHPVSFKDRSLFVYAHYTSMIQPEIGVSAYAAKDADGKPIMKGDRIDLPEGTYPIDFTVVGETAYMLTFEYNAADQNVRHRVWKSTDAINFTEVLQFDFQQTMDSFEYANGCFYFGAAYKDAHPALGALADGIFDKAGGIYRIDMAKEPVAKYVPLANTVRRLKSDKALKVAVIGDSIAYGQMSAGLSLQGYPFTTRVTTNSGGMPTGNPMSFARITTDYVKYLAKRDYGVDDVNINTFYSVWGGATAKSSFGYVTDDIIARQPDLVFYEIWNDNDETLRYAENTLRVLWKTLPNTDVVLISVGGAFSKSSVYQPLVEKYGVKWIDAYADVQTWFGQFGIFHSNTYGVVDADGKVSGTRGYLFGNGHPHVTEEGYIWFCDNIVKGLDSFFASAAGASGASEAVAPAGAIDGDLIAATGPEMYHAEIVTPASLTQASGTWTLTAKEVADEPRDTYDRANGDTIKAAAADATLTRTVTGKMLLFRGSKNMQYKIGDGEFAAISDGLFVSLGDDDVTVTLTLKATAKDASINEFYVYGKDYRTITPKATKHRYSVKFYAKVAPEYYHDWHLGGVQVIPHPMSWVNCYRMETYGAALTLPGESVISSQCEKNGAFLGWVEAEGVERIGSEVIPLVTTHEGKTIYAAGSTIDPKTLGRDVTLVAAYANGPVAKAEANVRKVTFVSENSANMKLLQFTPVYESAMSVTMPDLIPPVAGSTADGWKVVNTDTVYPVGAVAPITTDTEFIPVYTKTVAIDDKLLANCWTFDGTYMTDGSGWKLKAKVVGDQLEITAVTAQPADSSVKLDLGKFAVNSAHDTLYLGYLIDGNVFKGKTMACAVDLGYVTKIGQGAFGATGITDVRFGPYLEEIASGWANGAFAGCASLTNAAFAQGGSATVTVNEAFTFENCSALKTLDCSGIGYLQCRNNYGQTKGCSALTDVIIRAPSKIDKDFFRDAASVTYHFYGAAPELTSGTLNLGSGSTTYVHLDPESADYAAQLASWSALTEGGTINDKDSTWKTTIVSGSRPLLLYGVTPPPDDPPVNPPEEEDPEQPGEDPQPDDPPVAVDKWVLNAAGTEITDGTWTFKVSDSWGKKTIGVCIGYPDKLTPLDFSKPFVDQSDKPLTLSNFDSCFNAANGCEYVGAVTLPTVCSKLGSNVFKGCANMSIPGGFPQNLTSIGMYTFMNSGLSGDLELPYVTSLDRAAFKGTAITSVKLGAGLTAVNDAYDSGVFQSCKSLTNVTFNSASSVTLSGGEGYSFSGCTKLEQVDLSGVMALKCNNSSDKALFKGCSALKTVIISNCTSITAYVFDGAGAADYHFYGAAPAISEATRLGAVGGTTCVHLDQGSPNYNALLLGWGSLTEGGVLNETDSTWSSGYVVNGTSRPLLLVKYGTAPEVDPTEPSEDEPDGSYWLYDPEVGTVTDTFWTFLASDDGAGNIVFNAHTGAYPAVADDLDFSKPVRDAAKNPYTIVKLNPGFNNDTAGKRIARLVFPAEGVTEIGDNAFSQCTAITNIVNFLPDSVTKVGKYSFYKCPVKQTLYVKGVPRFGTGVGGNNNFSQCAFNSSSITRIVFGPGLKEIFDWDSGPFTSCTSLTNVTFDAAMTGAKFSGARNGGFYNCTALTGTIDLSGFSDLTYIGTVGGWGAALGNTAITKVILGAGLTKLHVNFFDQMGHLKEVVFNNAPGTGGIAFSTADSYNRVNGLMFGGLSASQAVIARIREEDIEAWRPYAHNGEITAIDSTFSEAFAGQNYTKRYLVIDGGDEPIGPLGEWVYDDAAGVVSNRLWAFEAEGVLSSLQTVGASVRHPDTPSLLDFSASVTDTRGLPMKILKLDTQFSKSDGSTTTPAGLAVAELRLPDGLVSIKGAAFACMNNCTNVVNFIPDTVTSVGNYAFYKLPAKIDLRIRGLVNMGTGTSDAYTYQFGSSKITSVTFGPGFKSLFSWSKSPFSGCTSLTNVTFDAATTGASFGGIRSDGFYNCTALTGTVDLSGFSNLSYVSDYGGGNNIFTGTKVEKFIVSEQCTKLAAGFFDGDTSLKEVVFMGPPPEITTNANTSSGWSARKPSKFYNYGQSSQKITTYITKENREAWAPYVLYNGQSVDKVPPGKGVTWKPEYVTAGIDLSLRPVRVLDMVPGLMLLVK